MDLERAREIERRCFFQVFTGIRMPLVPVRAEGALIWDQQGREYLDLTSGGRAVMGIGHCHPQVVAAICEQAGRLIHLSNDFYNEPALELAEKLASLSPLTRSFLCNSGAEANEAALKLARKWAKRQSQEKVEVVTALNSFHGRTLAMVTATGQPKYQHGFEPLVPGFRYVPYNDLAALESAVSDRTCAVMLEPVLGESGVYPATPEFLEGARRLCDRHQALLILDEVQTGMGRTGKMFAFQHYHLVPDIITLAKGLGGGFPIGAMLATEEAATGFGMSDHASTFGGGPLPAAAALAAVRAIQEEGLIERAARMGRYLLDGLRAIQARRPLIKELRGIGLMLAADLAEPKAGAVKQACLDRGLIIQTVGDSMLRLLPPMILTQAQAERALQTLEDALGAS